MRSVKWLRRAGWLSAIGIAIFTASASRADDDAAAPKQPEAAKEAAPADDASGATAPKAVKELKRVRKTAGGRFRLGLQLMPVLPALNDQLDLKGEGLVVEHVLPEGPADKAGIKRHDILLSIDDKPLRSIAGLLEAENASEGKELSLKLLRGGKPMTVNVTPAKREATFEVHVPGPGIVGGIDTEEIERLIKDKLKQAGADVRMEFLKPGKIFPPGAFAFMGRPDFPDDLSVTIQKQGKSPAAIEVKKGDKTWSVKEDDLHELPDDVRPHVEALLGRGPMPFTIGFGDRRAPGPPGRGPRGDRPDGPPPGAPEGPPPIDDGPSADRPARPPHPPGPPGRGDRDGRARERAPQARDRQRGSLDRRLEELSTRMQEMRRHMDELRESIRREREEARETDDNE